MFENPVTFPSLPAIEQIPLEVSILNRLPIWQPPILAGHGACLCLPAGGQQRLQHG